MRSFDAAVDEYDRARPAYPSAVYDVLDAQAGGLTGRTIADGGAGTGIVARQLLERGARVVAFDPGAGILGRAVAHTPGLGTLVAPAEAVPIRSHTLDMVCFGQSWHWVDQISGADEMARVLAPGGHWAAWWSHPWADDEPWFDRYYSLLESSCSGFSRHQRDVDWCAIAIADCASFDLPARHVVPWIREVSVGDWLTDLRSHSYIIDLTPAVRGEVLDEVGAILRDAFPGGTMLVPYQTRLWIARRI